MCRCSSSLSYWAWAIFSVVFAALIAFCISYIFFRKQRDAATEQMRNRFSGKAKPVRTATELDDADAEDALVEAHPDVVVSSDSQAEDAIQPAPRREAPGQRRAGQPDSAKPNRRPARSPRTSWTANSGCTPSGLPGFRPRLWHHADGNAVWPAACTITSWKHQPGGKQNAVAQVDQARRLSTGIRACAFRREHQQAGQQAAGTSDKTSRSTASARDTRTSSSATAEHHHVTQPGVAVAQPYRQGALSHQPLGGDVTDVVGHQQGHRDQPGSDGAEHGGRLSCPACV